MKWIKTAALAVLILAVVTPASAQRRGVRPMRSIGGAEGFGYVERALRMREEIKLTPTQITQLQNLRKELVAHRQKEAAEMIDLQSRIAAGDVARDEMRRHFEDRREQMEAIVKQRKEQFEKILTEDQRGQLNRAEMNMRRAELGRGGRGGFREPPRRGWR